MLICVRVCALFMGKIGISWTEDSRCHVRATEYVAVSCG